MMRKCLLALRRELDLGRSIVPSLKDVYLSPSRRTEQSNEHMPYLPVRAFREYNTPYERARCPWRRGRVRYLCIETRKVK
jgi:hypothetical protein